MNRTRLFFAVALLAAVILAPGGKASSQVVTRETQGDTRDLRLVLFLTVDQFRFDYLTRFASAYESGLARLVRDGAVFLNAQLEHYPTVTAPGHVAFGSGAMPSTSGGPNARKGCTTRSPASITPAWQTAIPIIGIPRRKGGNAGRCGRLRRMTIVVSSSGACAA